MTFRPFQWLRRRPARAGAPSVSMIEKLESRQLLSAATAIPAAVGDPDTEGPIVLNQQLLGSIDGVTSIKLQFNERLDPATAQDIAAYAIIRVFHIAGHEGGLIDEFVPVIDTSVGDSKEVNRLKLQSAVYDDATMTVTLTPTKPFRAGRYFRRLRVAGRGDHAVKDLTGNSLDGNKNGKNGDRSLIFFNLRKGRTLSYKERDGDRVKLTLTGEGKLFTFVRKKGKDKLPMVFLIDTVPGSSVVTGTVKKSKKGDGVADIPQITGTSTADVTFLSDPAFRIALTMPDASVLNVS